MDSLFAQHQLLNKAMPELHLYDSSDLSELSKTSVVSSANKHTENKSVT